MIWVNILQAAREGKVLTYQAPFDVRPVRLYPAGKRFTYQVQGDKIRITPGFDADPFTADEGHAERMNTL